MSQIPDLERLLSKYKGVFLLQILYFIRRFSHSYEFRFRIHSLGSHGIRADHPDTRAFLFEEQKYSKQKIIDFISTLNGFKKLIKIIESFDDVDENEMPALLRQCCRVSKTNSRDTFPDLTEHLKFFEVNIRKNSDLFEMFRLLPKCAHWFLRQLLITKKLKKLAAFFRTREQIQNTTKL